MFCLVENRPLNSNTKHCATPPTHSTFLSSFVDSPLACCSSFPIWGYCGFFDLTHLFFIKAIISQYLLFTNFIFIFTFHYFLKEAFKADVTVDELIFVRIRQYWIMVLNRPASKSKLVWLCVTLLKNCKVQVMIKGKYTSERAAFIVVFAGRHNFLIRYYSHITVKKLYIILEIFYIIS